MNDERHRSGLSSADYRELNGFDGDWRDSWWSDDFLDLMVSRFGIRDAATVLDVGCGVGHWGQRLLRFLPNAALTGVDAEASWLPEARARAAQRGLTATYREARGELLPSSFHEAGLIDIRTATNPQTAPCLPPYGDGDGAYELAERRKMTEAGRLMELGGMLENMRRMFLAGGGSAERFEQLVDIGVEAQRAELAAFDAQRYVTSGGHLPVPRLRRAPGGLTSADAILCRSWPLRHLLGPRRTPRPERRVPEPTPLRSSRHTPPTAAPHRTRRRSTSRAGAASSGGLRPSGSRPVRGPRLSRRRETDVLRWCGEVWAMAQSRDLNAEARRRRAAARRRTWQGRLVHSFSEAEDDVRLTSRLSPEERLGAFVALHVAILGPEYVRGSTRAERMTWPARLFVDSDAAA